MNMQPQEFLEVKSYVPAGMTIVDYTSERLEFKMETLTADSALALDKLGPFALIFFWLVGFSVASSVVGKPNWMTAVFGVVFAIAAIVGLFRLCVTICRVVVTPEAIVFNNSKPLDRREVSAFRMGTATTITHRTEGETAKTTQVHFDYGNVPYWTSIHFQGETASRDVILLNAMVDSVQGRSVGVGKKPTDPEDYKF